MERLRRSSDFALAQSDGRRVRGTHLQLIVAAGGAEYARCGFAVSRKVGNAVVRNRVKRWLRESTRGPWLAGPADLVFQARPGAGEAGFVVVAAEVAELLRRGAALGVRRRVVTNGNEKGPPG